MIYRIVSIQSRTDNKRIATVVDDHSTQGKEIECSITESGDYLHLLPVKSCTPTSQISNTFIITGKKLDDLNVDDTFIVED